MRKLIVIFLLVAVDSSMEAQTLSLSTILDSIERNPLLSSYRSKLRADTAMIGSANVWQAPKVGLELDNNPYSFDNFYNGTVRTSFSQDFPNRKNIDAQTNYLKSLSQIDLNESKYERNRLLSEAKSAYYGIYIMQKDIAILKESISVLKSMIEISEKQMSSGKGELAPIFKLKARLADKETRVVHDENMIRSYMVTINYLTNSNIDRVFAIDTNNIVKDYRNLTFIYNKDSIENKRSDIMQMNSLINSMKLNQNVISLQSKPIFGMKVENYTVFNGPDKFSLMGTMTIPLAPWSARGYKSQVRSMNYKITGLEEEKANMINMTSQMIKMLVIEMNSEYTEIDNYTQKVIPAYKKSFDAYLLAYGQNTSDILMTLMAYDDLQMAQMEYLKHLDALLKVQVDYEKELQIR